MLAIHNRKTLWINLLLLVAILVLLNLVSASLHTRLDLTHGQVYQLSDLSRQTVAELDDKLLVTAYFTRNLPPQEALVRDYALDLLEEYAAASGGRVEVRQVDPAARIENVEDANKHGIPHTTAGYFENDNTIVKEVFMGMVLSYANREETIPVVRETRGLEYEITLKMRKLLAKNLPHVVWVRPLDMRLSEIRPVYNRQQIHAMMQEMAQNPILDNQIRDELDRKDPLASIKERLRLMANLDVIDLWKPVEPDVECVVVSSITDSLSYTQLYNLDHYLMRGGNLVIFQDRMNLYRDDEIPIPSNFFDLLEHWGVRLSQSFVLDRACMADPENPNKRFFEIIRIDRFNHRNPVTKDLVRMYLNFASPLDTTRVNEGVTFSPLLFSSEESIAIERQGMSQRVQGFYLNNYLREDPKVMAGLYEGRFTSMFTGAGGRKVLRETDKGRILVVGDSDCPEYRDNETRLMTPNEVFVLNAVDYLRGDFPLIELRSRRIANSPITWTRFFPTSFESVEELQYVEEQILQWKQAVKWANILLPSILLVIFGLLRWRAEVRRRRKLSGLYRD